MNIFDTFQEAIIQAPFAGMEHPVPSHATLFGTDELVALYEELGVKMESFLNSIVNIPAMQVSFVFVMSVISLC